MLILLSFAKDLKYIRSALVCSLFGSLAFYFDLENRKANTEESQFKRIHVDMLSHGLHFIQVLVIFMTVKNHVINYLIGVPTIFLSSLAFAINVRFEQDQNLTVSYAL